MTANHDQSSAISEKTNEDKNNLWSEGVTNSVSPDDIIWMMDWTLGDRDGVRAHPDKPESEEIFEIEAVVAILLINEIIFLITNSKYKEWPKQAQKTTSLHVGCSDCFVWASCDSELIELSEIESLYRLWLKYPKNAKYLWCAIARNQLPQKPIVNKMIEEGIVIEDYVKKHGLRPNFYDGVSHVVANLKYIRYSEWCVVNGDVPMVFDKNWWDGWYKFIAANPDWNSAEWKRKEFLAINEWRELNGYEVLT